MFQLLLRRHSFLTLLIFIIIYIPLIYLLVYLAVIVFELKSVHVQDLFLSLPLY